MDIAAIRAAAARLHGRAVHTPLLSAPLLDRLAGRRVLVKAECLQLTGSFKFRGAWAALTALPHAQLARGVIAFSSGNHAQGVAHAAQLLKAPAVIVMPADAPAPKIANTRAYGAEVVLYDREREDREAIGARIADERGLALVRPYDDAQVIAGQGTIGLELAQQARDAGVRHADVLVPASGGGLAAGIALALAAEAPGLRVRTVEPEGFDDIARSLASGTRQSNPRLTGSIQDAILSPAPGQLTLPVLRTHAGAGLAVSDDAALRAMAAALLRLKLMLEPGGAAALAAALAHPGGIEGEAVIVVASGGNADPAMAAQALSRFASDV